MNIFDRMAGWARVASIVAVVAILAALVVVLWPQKENRELTAYFPRSVSLYEGSDVRVLGVKIGEVEKVDPAGTTVRVLMTYDEEFKIPANAKAVIISPSIVGDRYVQLTPAYSGGPVLANGDVIEEDRTAVPLELDEIYQALDDLNVALGPQGANKDGALSKLVDVTAKNFKGQGGRFKQTIIDLGTFSRTLDNNKEELFSSLQQLARFTQTLKQNDSNIRKFNRDLATLSEFLNGERDDLAKALDHLAVAMEDVTGFIRDNKRLLKSNIDGLAQFTQVLVKQQEALKEIMDTAPQGIVNLGLAGNAATGTLDTRMNIGQNLHQLENEPAMVLCGFVQPEDPTGEACGAIKDVFDQLPLPRAKPFGKSEAPATHAEYIDPTLAGILPEGGQ